jgi:hypothetical protein
MGRNYSPNPTAQCLHSASVFREIAPPPELRSSCLLVHDGTNTTFVLTLDLEEQVLT